MKLHDLARTILEPKILEALRKAGRPLSGQQLAAAIDQRFLTTMSLVDPLIQAGAVLRLHADKSDARFTTPFPKFLYQLPEEQSV